jgi:ATP-dependent DNA ligase
VWLTPVTRDRTKAEAWLERFEGAGLDGVIAKDEKAAYQPGKRVMLKIKHARTADCVVGGFRWFKNHPDAVGSLLLGLFDDAGTLQHVGITSSFKMAERRRLVTELAPLRVGAHDGHPWTDGASEGTAFPGARHGGAAARISRGCPSAPSVSAR